MMIEIKSTCCGVVICSGHDVPRMLEEAVATGVSLRYADLSQRWLPDVNLRGADLGYADLRGTVLTNANLRGASIAYADVEDTDFRGADLRDVCYSGVNFKGIQLRRAKTMGMWTAGSGGLVVRRRRTIGDIFVSTIGSRIQ